MFQLLEPTTMKLKKAGTHVDKHDDKERLTLELRVGWSTSNRNLNLIRKGLSEFFFCDMRTEIEGKQKEMDLPVDELPNVKFPSLKYPITDGEFELMGARVEIAYGIDDVSAIVLQLCRVHKLQYTPIEGGSAYVEYSISSSADIDGDTIGKVMLLQKHEISLKQTMPDLANPTKQLTPEDVFPDTPQTEPEKPLTVEDVFVNQSTSAEEKKPVVTKKRPLAKKIAAAGRKKG